MTNLLSFFDPRSAVGFDEMYKRLESVANTTLKAVSYPPYNIKKVGDNKYLVELAVAGFGKTDIDITLEENVLKISGKMDSGDAESNYLYKGIAERGFMRNFTLADTIEVKNAELINGVLKVWLENILPDHKKTRKVEITDKVEENSKKEVLKG
jgi:molecular chaperone IbpA